VDWFSFLFVQLQELPMDPSQVPNVVFPIFFGSLSVATSLFIWYMTVKETQRRHEETMKVAQQRHEEVMKVAQQRHEEALKEAQQRHRETVLLAVLAAQQRGQDPNFLYLRPLLRHVEETERDERALGSTGESILGAAVPVVVGSGDPPAVIQDDEKMPEGEAVCASFFQSPALHGHDHQDVAPNHQKSPLLQCRSTVRLLRPGGGPGRLESRLT
jgi:hypothetical protein